MKKAGKWIILLIVEIIFPVVDPAVHTPGKFLQKPVDILLGVTGCPGFSCVSGRRVILVSAGSCPAFPGRDHQLFQRLRVRKQILHESQSFVLLQLIPAESVDPLRAEKRIPFILLQESIHFFVELPDQLCQDKAEQSHLILKISIKAAPGDLRFLDDAVNAGIPVGIPRELLISCLQDPLLFLLGQLQKPDCRHAAPP